MVRVSYMLVDFVWVNFVAFDDLACPAAEPLLQNYKQPNRVDSETLHKQMGHPAF